ASTTSRVYQSAFFALRDTRTPARIAGLRVAVSVLAGALLMLELEQVSIRGVALPGGALSGWTVEGLPLGPVGLALGSAIGAWIEWGALVRRLRGRLGRVGAGSGAVTRMLAAALAASAAGHAARMPLEAAHPLVAALGVALAFGIVYFGAARLLRIAEAREVIGALRRRFRRGEASR